jgi:hypothetical protein
MTDFFEKPATDPNIDASLDDRRRAREFCARAATMNDFDLQAALAADVSIFVDLAPYLDRATLPRVARVMTQTIKAAGLDPFAAMGLEGSTLAEIEAGR